MQYSTPAKYNIEGHRVAILATHGYETSELNTPREALREAGADVTVVSLPESDERIRGFTNGEWRREVTVDKTLPDVSASQFHSLVLPGGLMNPDRLRSFDSAVGFDLLPVDSDRSRECRSHLDR